MGGRVKDWRDGFKEWLNRQQPRMVERACPRCVGSQHERNRGEYCSRCKGLGRIKVEEQR